MGTSCSSKPQTLVNPVLKNSFESLSLLKCTPGEELNRIPHPDAGLLTQGAEDCTGAGMRAGASTPPCARAQAPRPRSVTRRTPPRKLLSPSQAWLARAAAARAAPSPAQPHPAAPPAPPTRAAVRRPRPAPAARPTVQALPAHAAPCPRCSCRGTSHHQRWQGRGCMAVPSSGQSLASQRPAYQAATLHPCSSSSAQRTQS